MLKHTWFVALVAAAAFDAPPLAAQPSERDDPHLRSDCRLAAQVLRMGHPAPRREWAIDAIRRCDQSGPVVLADVWRTSPPAGSAELEQLFHATREFNDRRVVDAVADVARQRTAAETTRIYAFALLFSYAVPGLYIDVCDLLNPRGTPARIGGSTHDERTYDTLAVLGDLRPEVSEILRSVAEAEPESRVGTAAATVLRRLRNF